MLARKMSLKLEGWGEVGTTPMLIPAFSSTVDINSSFNTNICKLIKTMDEFIKGPILISAYDLCYVKGFPKLTFPTIIFIDSGGYECSFLQSVSKFGIFVEKPKIHLDRKKHRKVIKNFIQKYKKTKPLVIISYDHPSRRESLDKQINHAEILFNEFEGVLKEIIFKPDVKDDAIINFDEIIKNIHLLKPYDIIGFTEKELGESFWKRMLNIARLRTHMDKNNIKKPIHIFGSLDAITTPLYYFSGADIFDGLTWIRYIFDNGNSFYFDGYGAKFKGIQSDVDTLSMTVRALNNRYLESLQMKLENFQSSGKFSEFGKNKDFFNKTHNELMLKLKEVV